MSKLDPAIDRASQHVARPMVQLERHGSRDLAQRIASLRVGGGEVLPLAGAPLLPLPHHVTDAVKKAMNEHHTKPSRGVPELRIAISKHLQHKYGLSIDPEANVLVTNGAQHALNVVFRALLAHGDRVVAPSPVYFYGGLVQLIGAEPFYVPCYEREDWRWDLSRISDACGSNTKLFVACNPVNPTGYLPTRQELNAIVEMADKWGFIVLSDESYERFVYEGESLYSVGRLQELRPNTIMIRSMSKSYAMSSWRIGYIVAHSTVIDACLKVLEWECLCCNYVAQKAAAAAIEGPQDWLRDVVPRYERNRNIAYGYVQRIQSMSCTCPKAGPFLFINVSQLGEDCRSLAEDMLLEAGIPAIAGWYFQAPGYIRVPFGGEISTIHALGESLQKWADGS